MPPFVDLWGWFNGHRVQAERENNTELLRLVSIFKQAWNSFEPEPSRALILCNEAISLSKQLHLPCMALFYSYWRCELYLFYLRQIDVGLKETVSLALDAQKPEHAQCPIRGRVFRVLMDAHFATDAYGYADEIEAVLDYMEREVPLDRDTWQLAALGRVRLAENREDFEKALELIDVYRARCETNKFRLLSAYGKLCWLNYKLKHYQLIGAYAEAGEECARSVNRVRSLSNFLAWKAFALQVAGQTAEARRMAAESMRQANSVKAFPHNRETLSFYYEVRGDYDQALVLRRERLELASATGAADEEAYARLEVCKMMAKMNQPLGEELALARKATGKLRRPEKIREKLARLERGEILD